MNVELAGAMDEKLLMDVLSDEKYEWIRSYDVHIKMFYKYGKYDKDGNLKTPALVKNGQAIPLVIKIVSSFNRLTDDVDVKIVVNIDLWDEYSKEEKIAALDGILHYLELKTDKTGEPLPISEENDKVQLKLKKPDFFCEGFNCLAEKYGKNYGPIQDAQCIINLLNNHDVNVTKSKTTKTKSTEQTNVNNQEESKQDDYDDSEVNLDDINLDI